MVAAVLSACGDFSPATSAQTSDSRAIINGTVTPDGQFPEVGALLSVARMEFGGEELVMGQVLCSGTLIAKDTVLTAAHCQDFFFADFAEIDYYFTFSHDVSDFGASETIVLPPKTYAVAALAPHEAFDLDPLMGEVTTLGVDNTFYDIGLAFLETPVEDIAPAPLGTDQLLAEGQQVHIVGYGLTDANASRFQADTHGVKYHALSVINELGATEMQIGNTSPTPQKCNGDSGGPTFLEDDEHGVLWLVGVTSHAYDAENGCNKGGVDTRVDVYDAWIRDTMQNACNTALRPLCPHPDLGLPPDVGPGLQDGPPGSGNSSSTGSTDDVTGVAEGSDSGGSVSRGWGYEDDSGCQAVPSNAAILLIVGLGFAARRRRRTPAIA